MRMRRLMADWHSLRQLSDESPLIDVSCTGYPPEKYVITYRCKGLVKNPGAVQPSLSVVHQVEIYLHLNYPRLQPRLTWLTEIFHPNILSYSHNGGVCIGSWTPAESLAKLTLRIGEMIQYKSYNPYDPLDKEAAAWTLQHEHLLPVDPRPLVHEAVQFDRPSSGDFIEVTV